MQNNISNLKIERVRQGLTQLELGMKAGIPQYRISLIERLMPPNLEEMKKLSEALNCKVEDLFPSIKNN